MRIESETLIVLTEEDRHAMIELLQRLASGGAPMFGGAEHQLAVRLLAELTK